MNPFCNGSTCLPSSSLSPFPPPLPPHPLAQVHAFVGKTVRVEAEDTKRSDHYGEHGTVVSIQEEGEEEEATVLTEDSTFRISVKCLVKRTEKELKKHKELMILRPRQSSISKCSW